MQELGSLTMQQGRRQSHQDVPANIRLHHTYSDKFGFHQYPRRGSEVTVVQPEAQGHW